MAQSCTNCGTPLPDGASFCPKCGIASAVASAPVPPLGAPASWPSEPPPHPPIPKNNTKPIEGRHLRSGIDPDIKMLGWEGWIRGENEGWVIHASGASGLLLRAACYLGCFEEKREGYQLNIN